MEKLNVFDTFSSMVIKSMRKQNTDTLEDIPFVTDGTVDILCITVTLLLLNLFTANIFSSYHVSLCNPDSM